MKLQLAPVGTLPLERYAGLLGAERMRWVWDRVAALRARLSGRTVWNVSSTFSGGGVAEMVRSLLAYARGAGVDARWAVLQGPPEFFHVTKRLHHALHGSPGDGSPLGPDERRRFEEVGWENAKDLLPFVRPSDVVIVHDPQPAGMIPALASVGARVIWRCHVGSDRFDPQTDLAWSFLAPYLRHASGYVFSREAYVPPVCDRARTAIIPPSLDAFSAKNQSLPDDAVRAILAASGLLAAPPVPERATFVREDGTVGTVGRLAHVVREGGPPSLGTPVVVQVSRWDPLKDPLGVLRGFARATGPARSAHLVLAGPSLRGVADDPEDADVYSDVVGAWAAMPADVRARVTVAAIPTDDVEENAAMVNALQRYAAVIVQKSLHEGFGLTVTEAMWKRRPVVASAVGGIVDQIDDGVTGVLLRDPTDLDAMAAAVDRLLGDATLASRLGQAGHDRVKERYLGIDSLLAHGALIERLLDAAP